MTRHTLLFALILLSGCDPVRQTYLVTIPHPATAPVIPAATQINRADPAAARRAHLAQDALVDRAAITRLDDDGVCVQVSLFATQEDAARADLDRYLFSLIVERRDADERTPLAPASQATLGAWETTAPVRRWVFMGFALGLVEQEGELRRLAHTGADLCFEQRGLTSDGVRALSLVVQRDQGELYRYQWELDPGAAYSAEQRSVGPTLTIGPESPGRSAATHAASAAGGLSGRPYPSERLPGGHPVDEGALDGLIEERRGQLALCISRAAEEDPRVLVVRGQTTAEFTVGPGGVRNVRILSNDRGPAVGRCVARFLRELPVPEDPLRWTTLYHYQVRNDGRRPGR